MFKLEKEETETLQLHIFVRYCASVTVFRPDVPLAQAELPDNQNIAKTVVNMKSYANIFQNYYCHVLSESNYKLTANGISVLVLYKSSNTV